MFLLKRSPPWAWAGWIDDFNRPVEVPIQQPWGLWGSSGGAEINNLQEMRVINSTRDLMLAGGPSYEFMPFTPNYGIEYEVWWPSSTGFVADALMLFLMENYSKVGRSLSNLTIVGLWNRPAIDGQTVKISTLPGYPSSVDFTHLASGASPVAFNGNAVHLKILVDADALVRCYVNNQIVCQALLTGDYKTGPGRRGVNISSFGPDAWFRWIKVYDRPSIIPNPDAWISQFYDDFNRANGAPGNGWTQMGAEGQIVSGSYSMTGGTNGSRAIIRNTGVTTGRQRVEAIAGGANGVSDTRDSSLVLRCNAEGTQGLSLNFFSNHAYLARFSTSLNGGSVTFHDFVDTGVTVNNGDKLAFSAIGDTAWGEINGNIVIIAGNVSAVVPETNSYAGLRVERDGDYSHSWNDFRFLTT